MCSVRVVMVLLGLVLVLLSAPATLGHPGALLLY
jgi:hypothetical protein